MDMAKLGIFFTSSLFILYLASIFMVYHSLDFFKGLIHAVSFLMHFLVVIIPFIIFIFIEIPLPLFYIIIYFTCHYTLHYLYANQHGRWLLGNLHYMFFTSIHLIVLGCLTGIMRYDIKEVLTHNNFKIASLCIALIINIIILYFIKINFQKKPVVLEDLEGEEFQLFSKFIWFCSIFVMLDSIPFLFPMPIKLSSLFMIGTNFLLLAMVLLFGQHTYSLINNHYIKEQHIHLKAEKSKQLNQIQHWEQQAYQDSLTQAYTRTYILNNLKTMLKEKELFSLVFIDLDGLKKINDEKGHIAGDEILRKFSNCMIDCLRPKDIFARYGGDEFLILMPEYTMIQTRECVEKCKEQMDDCSFSYGIACVTGNENIQPEELISIADQEMYKAKQKMKKAGGK